VSAGAKQATTAPAASTAKRDAEAFDTKLRALKSAGGLDIFNAGEQTLSDYAEQVVGAARRTEPV
jgi:hypothetical protein